MIFITSDSDFPVCSFISSNVIRSAQAAQAHRDSGRRLHRAGIRLHLRQSRQRRHGDLSRRQYPARLRRRGPRAARDGGHPGRARRSALPRRDRADRPGGRPHSRGAQPPLCGQPGAGRPLQTRRAVAPGMAGAAGLARARERGAPLRQRRECGAQRAGDGDRRSRPDGAVCRKLERMVQRSGATGRALNSAVSGAGFGAGTEIPAPVPVCGEHEK